MEKNIQVNPTPDFTSIKEISCKDCGEIYSAPAAAVSSACEACGNIAFHPQFTTATVRAATKEERRLAAQALARPTPAPAIATPAAMEYHEILRRQKIDPARIEEISMQNQLEWQLWAKVTSDFGDLNAHLAYLSFATRSLAFEKASERYKAHRSRFALVHGERWQADRADAMLDRIQALCLVQFEREQHTPIGEFERWAVGRQRVRPILWLVFLLFGAALAASVLVPAVLQ